MFKPKNKSRTAYQSSMTPVAQLDNVALRYGKGPEILTHIRLRLNPGSFYYLTGSSGAGKSSLMRLLYLAIPPSRGIMHMFGQNVTKLARRDFPSLRQRIGVVFQDFRLLPHLTTFQNVALPLRLMGESEEKSISHVSELLDWVGLADYANHFPAQLSGGQQQSAAIARAVIGRPRLLLADEPTGNLDNYLAEKLLLLFEELNRQGTTIFIATHNQDLMQRIKHPQLVIENGRLYGD